MISDGQWKYGGAVIIAVFSSLIYLPAIPNIFIPIPVYLLLLAWAFVYAPPFVVPILYIAFLFTWERTKYFSQVIFITACVLFTLNLFYLVTAFDGGINFNGELHTGIVILVNILGMALVFFTLLKAIKNNSQNGKYLANLILFILLSWYLFPTLGELP